MNALSIIFVSQYLDDLRAQSPQYPTAARVAKRGMRERVAAATAHLRSSIRYPDDDIVPELRNHPYGG